MLQRIETQTGSQKPCRVGFQISTLEIGNAWDKVKIDKRNQIHRDDWPNYGGLQKFCAPPKAAC